MHDALRSTLCALAVSVGAAVCADAQQPRYKFPIGRELVYLRELQRLDAAEESKRENQQVTLLVLGRDEQWATLLIDVAAVDASGSAGPAWGAVLQCSSRGVVRAADVVRATAPREMLAAVADVLIELPRAIVADSGAWTTEPDAAGRAWRVRAAPAREGAGRTQQTWQAVPSARRANVQCERSYTFDRGAGRLAELRSDIRQDGALERVRVTPFAERQPAERVLERRRVEAERLTNALHAADRMRRLLATQPASAAQWLERRERLWRELAASCAPDSPIRRVARGYAQRDRAARAERAADARLAAQFVGTVAAAWTLPNADGRAIASEAARGRGPAVEFFWSAAMPRARESLALLGRIRAADPRIACIALNLDQRVAKQVPVEPPTGVVAVVSGPPLDGAVPERLPVIRLIDSEDRIRAVFFGYQPTLLTDVLTIFSNSEDDD